MCFKEPMCYMATYAQGNCTRYAFGSLEPRGGSVSFLKYCPNNTDLTDHWALLIQALSDVFAHINSTDFNYTFPDLPPYPSPPPSTSGYSLFSNSAPYQIIFNLSLIADMYSTVLDLSLLQDTYQPWVLDMVRNISGDPNMTFPANYSMDTDMIMRIADLYSSVHSTVPPPPSGSPADIWPSFTAFPGTLDLSLLTDTYQPWVYDMLRNMSGDPNMTFPANYSVDPETLRMMLEFSNQISPSGSPAYPGFESTPFPGTLDLSLLTDSYQPWVYDMLRNMSGDTNMTFPANYSISKDMLMKILDLYSSAYSTLPTPPPPSASAPDIWPSFTAFPGTLDLSLLTDTYQPWVYDMLRNMSGDPNMTFPANYSMDPETRKSIIELIAYSYSTIQPPPAFNFTILNLTTLVDTYQPWAVNFLNNTGHNMSYLWSLIPMPTLNGSLDIYDLALLHVLHKNMSVNDSSLWNLIPFPTINGSLDLTLIKDTLLPQFNFTLLPSLPLPPADLLSLITHNYSMVNGMLNLTANHTANWDMFSVLSSILNININSSGPLPPPPPPPMSMNTSTIINAITQGGFISPIDLGGLNLTDITALLAQFTANSLPSANYGSLNISGISGLGRMGGILGQLQNSGLANLFGGQGAPPMGEEKPVEPEEKSSASLLSLSAALAPLLLALFLR